MTNKTHFSPTSVKGHFGGIVDDGKHLRQSSLYKQILPRPVRRSFSEGGTQSRSKTICVNPVNLVKKTSCLSVFVAKTQRNLRLINDLRDCNPLYICRDTFTDVMSALQIAPVLTNKPNLLDGQMNVSSFITTNYEQRTMNYEIKTNPIQSQFKPNTKPIQTQNKPNTKPNKPNFRWKKCCQKLRPVLY